MELGILPNKDTQTPSHFINEEIDETIVTTTQQSISPIHPNLTTLRPKNPILPQVTIQYTVKPSFAPKYSHMDYQTYRSMTKPSQYRKAFTRNILQNTIIIMSIHHKQLIPPKYLLKIICFHKNQFVQIHHQT